MKKIEYKVRPVTRYVVTRYEEGIGSSTKGEYDNQEMAYEVGHALAKDELNRLGLPVGDTTVMFPEPIWGVKHLSDSDLQLIFDQWDGVSPEGAEAQAEINRRLSSDDGFSAGYP